MALQIRALTLTASVPVDTNKSVGFYKYATPDAAATVIAAGYFNDARDKLAVNDIIECVCVATGTGDRVVVRVTAVPSSGNVTVAADPSSVAA